MINLLEVEKNFLIPHIKKGGVAVDFTMGNGHDTLWLSNAVGEEGKVYAFDIQPEALKSTEARLKENGAPENYTLIHHSHHKGKEYVKTPFRVGMFNLGWLPGGDKSITTMRETTLPAIRDAIELLDRDGILNIAIYPGHKEGEEEGKMICEYLSSLSRFKVCVTRVQIINSPTSPYFLMVETKP